MTEPVEAVAAGEEAAGDEPLVNYPIRVARDDIARLEALAKQPGMATARAIARDALRLGLAALERRHK